MRSLSAPLTSNQSGLGVTGLPYTPIWRIVLTRAGQDTKTYTKTRVLSITHIEEEYNQTATVLLDNSDGALTSINFEMYKGVISYGYNDPTQGDEYSPCAPLFVTRQRLFSAQGVLVCQLVLIGIPNLLGIDLAESEYTQTDGDVQTVKDLITAVGNATLSPYTNYTNYTVTYDSEDSLIDSFTPKDSFRVALNASRLSKIQELLSWTGSKMRVEDDGEIHVFDPVITGDSFLYEYKLVVTGEHTFFNKELRNRFINPNKETVSSHPSVIPGFSGSATSATSFALFPQPHTTYLKLASDAEATSIATAIIERYELDADNGSVVVTMNVGQEVFDFIKVTDSRQNDSRAGSVRYIRREVQIPQRGGSLVWDMEIQFGKDGLQPITVIPPRGARGAAGEVTITTLLADLDDLDADFRNLARLLLAHIQDFNDHLEHGIFKKLTVLEDLIIPIKDDD